MDKIYVVACNRGFVRIELPQSGIVITKKYSQALKFIGATAFDDAWTAKDKLQKQEHVTAVIIEVED